MYEVTASGKRVAVCMDKHDAEDVAAHWYDAKVREANVWIMDALPAPSGMGTYTYVWPHASTPLPEPKRKGD
jgi:hypothetical protein